MGRAVPLPLGQRKPGDEPKSVHGVPPQLQCWLELQSSVQVTSLSGSQPSSQHPSVLHLAQQTSPHIWHCAAAVMEWWSGGRWVVRGGLCWNGRGRAVGRRYSTMGSRHGVRVRGGGGASLRTGGGRAMMGSAGLTRAAAAASTAPAPAVGLAAYDWTMGAGNMWFVSDA